MQLTADTQSQLSNRQRDYLLITVFVLAQHCDYARAKQIIDGMLALGERTEKILISQAVLEFFCGNYTVSLQCLDDLDQMASAGNTGDQDEKRMRQYLRARCYYSNGRQQEAHAIATQLASKPVKTRQL